MDRRAYEIAVIVHLRERLASGAIWVEGSRAYRTLSDYLLPKPAFETMLLEQNVPVAVDTSFAAWLADRRQRLGARMAEVNRKALKGQLPDVTLDDGGLKISPLRNAVPEEAEVLKAQLYGLLPRIRITDLLAEVAVWTGFGDHFAHVRSGDPPQDGPALMAAILADATNLGLGRMAESSQGLTHARLIWTAQWHIRDLSDRRLYTLTPSVEFAALDQLIGGTINVKAIEDDWKDVLHLAASIRTGTVSASVMLKKLAGYSRQNSLSRALREIGRLERSLFMLDWLDDIDLRRRTNANLNKGEARNALARAVFFNRLGEIRDRTFENQRHRASGLNLVSAAIILWNTVYLGQAADYLRGQGRDINDALLSHSAPLGWEHISLTGDYLWGDMKLPEDGFRPLRTQNRQSEP